MRPFHGGCFNRERPEKITSLIIKILSVEHKITCIRCENKKDKEDFYWKKESPTELKSKRCKKCVLELAKLKKQEKKRDAIYAF